MKPTSQPPKGDTDELRDQVLTEFKQVLKLAPTDYTENCTNVVMCLVESYASQREIDGRINEIKRMVDADIENIDDVYHYTDARLDELIKDTLGVRDTGSAAYAILPEEVEAIRDACQEWLEENHV